MLKPSRLEMDVRDITLDLRSRLMQDSAATTFHRRKISDPGIRGPNGREGNG